MAKGGKSARDQASSLTEACGTRPHHLYDRLHYVALELTVIGDAIVGAELDTTRTHGLTRMLYRQIDEIKEIGKAVHKGW